MATEVRKITESRKAQRDATQLEFRGPMALEQIADTLEAIRIDAAMFHDALVRSVQLNAPKR
jgi:hypothetical protein